MTPEEQAAQIALLRKQLEDASTQEYYPWNWWGERAAQLEQQKQDLRRRIANSYEPEGIGIPPRVVPPQRKASGGSISPLERQLRSESYQRLMGAVGGKHVPRSQYGFVRHPSSAPAFAEGGPITGNLVRAVIQRESSGDPNAKSPKGALGLMQLMPSTAKDLGVDPLDPVQNVEGGTRYLQWLYKQTGNLRDALIAYNWGIGNVKKFGTKKIPKETENYVEKVMALLGKAEAKQEPTVASAPLNKQDTTPQPTPSGDTAPQPSSTDTQVAMGGGGNLPAMSKYAAISNPPPVTESPVETVNKILKDPMSLSREAKNGGSIRKYAEGGEIKNTPRNKVVGGLSDIAGAYQELSKSARELPYVGWLVPSFENFQKAADEASYGMPLTTGKGIAGTLGLRPEVGKAILELPQIGGLSSAGRVIGGMAEEQLPSITSRVLERSPILSLASPVSTIVKGGKTNIASRLSEGRSSEAKNWISNNSEELKNMKNPEELIDYLELNHSGDLDSLSVQNAKSLFDKRGSNSSVPLPAYPSDDLIRKKNALEGTPLTKRRTK